MRFFASALGLAAVLLSALASGQTNDAGTRLKVSVNDPIIDCATEGTSASVIIGYQFTSSGSVDSVAVTAVLDRADLPFPPIASGMAPDGDWTGNGRNKVADAEFRAALPNGHHDFQVCGAQSGADGRTGKSVCSGVVPVVVRCAVADPCLRIAPDGTIGKNRDVCSGEPIELALIGSFGNPAYVQVINTDTDMAAQVEVPNAQACSYIGSFDPALNGFAKGGLFVFEVLQSTGDPFRFSATLTCGGGSTVEEPAE